MGKREKKMLTVKEAAARLGAAEISIRVWAKDGRFPGARKESTPMGEYWLIPEAALEGFEMGSPGRPPKSAKPKGKRR
jgi:excisionase family DNA binding protein